MRMLVLAVGLAVGGVGGGAAPAGASTVAVVELSGTWSESASGASIDLSGTATGVNGLTPWVREPTQCGGSFSAVVANPPGFAGQGSFGCSPSDVTPYSWYFAARIGNVLKLRIGPPNPPDVLAFGVSLECALVPNQLPPGPITSYAATCTGVAARP